MNGIAELHAKAMTLYDTALAHRRAGDEELFRSLVAEALEAEAAAAQEVDRLEPTLEPTRSILFRSAATLAITGRAFDRALALASAGLAASTAPAELRAELVALVKDANYRLHIQETDGVTIGDESITMSLEGEAVGNGMVRQEVFKQKLNSLVNIINRTVDRARGIPFGEARDKYTAPIFVSPPIPGSFAIEVKLGDQRQPDIDGMPAAVDADAVLNSVVECFQDFRDGDLDSLREKIPDDDYYTNFVGLGRTLQPDGSAITAVELVGNLHKGVKRVRITSPKPRAPKRKRPAAEQLPTVEVTGLLRVAEKRDEGKEQVGVIDDDGRWHTIHVPAALMADVVKPLWDCRVMIVAKVMARGVLELDTIDPA